MLITPGPPATSLAPRLESDRDRVARIADKLLAEQYTDNRPDAVRYAMLLLVAAERSMPATTLSQVS